MSVVIKGITVTASSRRQAPGRSYESDENFTSFYMEKENGETFSLEEALVFKFRVTLSIKRALLLDELSQGLITPRDYMVRSKKLESRYSRMLDKVSSDPSFLTKIPEVEDEP